MSIVKLSGKSGRIKLGTAVAITGATGTTTIVVSSTLAPAVGDVVLISGVVGMTDLNNGGKGHVVTAIGTGTFTVVLATATAQTWTSGGTAQKILPITGWDIDLKSDVADVTDSESGEWKERIVAGQKEWSGKYTGFYADQQGTPPLASSLAAEFDIDATNGWSGTAIFDAASIGVKVPGADAVSVSGTFQGSGALAIV